MFEVPSWATTRETADGRLNVYDVDADKMYKAMLTELAKKQAERGLDRDDHGAEVLAVDGEGKPTETLGKIEAKNPDQYSLEVAYQCMKLELQVAHGGFGFEIRVHDPKKKFAQASAPTSDRAVTRNGKAFAGAEIAAAPGGPNEAREHYKRLRGFIPGA